VAGCKFLQVVGLQEPELRCRLPWFLVATCACADGVLGGLPRAQCAASASSAVSASLLEDNSMLYGLFSKVWGGGVQVGRATYFVDRCIVKCSVHQE